MPLIEEVAVGVTGTEPAPVLPKPEPKRSLTGATFEQENELYNYIGSTQIGNRVEPGFNIADELRKRKLEHLYDRVVWVNNPDRLDVELSRIKREQENREIIDAAPWYESMPLGVFAGLLSPWNLLPGGQIVKNARGGYSIFKSAGTTAGMVGLSALGQESTLQMLQSTRDTSESVVNIAGAMVLGGFLGAGAVKILSRAERQIGNRVVAEIMSDPAVAEVIAQRTRKLNEQDVVALRESWDAAGLPGAEFDRFRKLVEWKSADEIASDLRHVATSDFRAAMKDLGDEAASVGRMESRAAPAGEPPIPEGYYRMYHGGGAAAEDGSNFGRWFTTDRKYAANYGGDIARKNLYYVDVPKTDKMFELDPHLKDQTVEAGFHVSKELSPELTQQMKLLGPTADFKAAEETMTSPKVDQAADLVRPGEAGARAAERRSWQEQREAYGVRGAITNEVSKIGRQFFPGLRLTHSPLPSARRLFNQMVGSNVYLNDAATNAGGSAFDQMKVIYHQLKDEGLRQQFRNYREMKRAGINMRWEDYDSAVGEALRNEDVGANEFISKGASIWRSVALNPMLKHAMNVGALTMADIEKIRKNAKSYFPRSHNKKMFVQYRNVAEQRLMPHAMEALEAGFRAATEEKDALVAKLERQMAFLNLDREGRAKIIESIDEEIARLGESFPEEASKYAKIEEINEKLKDKALSPEVRTQLKNDRDDLRAALKSTDFETKQRALQADRKFADSSFGGMEEKSDKIIEGLQKLADDQLRQTHRLIKKGQQFEREKNRLAPEVWEKKRAELKATFEEREQGYADALVRLEDQEYKLDLERKALEDRIEEAKVKPDGQEATNFDVIKQAQVELAKFNEAIKPILKKIAAEKKRVERSRLAMERVNNRLEAAEQFDNDGIMEAFRIATAELQQDLANSMMFRGMRAQKTLDRLDKVGPDVVKAKLDELRERVGTVKNKFEDRWMPERQATPPFKDWAEGMVREYIDAVTGIRHDKVENFNEYALPLKVGPLKDRANWFPESALTEPVAGGKGFLNSDASLVMNHYLRVMAGDVGLRRVFGEISMQNGLAEISQEFDMMNKAIGQAKSVEELKEIVGDTGIRFAKDLETSRQRAYSFLTVQHRKAHDDLEAMRDRTLGRYLADQSGSNAGRVVRAANQLNYIRKMGGVVLASATELYRPAMVHGLGNFFNHLVTPMLSDIEALKLGRDEARMLGLVGEMVSLHRMHDMAQIADPLARGTWIERLIDSGTSGATRWNGLAAWTDIMQAQSAIITQARILKAIQSGTEKDYLRFLGIDEGYASIIDKMFRQYGEVRSGVYLANPQKWTDGLSDLEAGRIENARMAFWSAIRKEVDSIIVMQSAGDTPLFASTNLGKAILQFRAYNMSAHQKVMLRGMQEGPARFFSGLTTMSILGAGVAATQAWSGGTERWEKFKQSAANPGFLLGEGLDKSGIFPLLMDIGQGIDSIARATGHSFNPIKTPMLMPFPEESQAGDQTRWAGGQGAWGLLGPTASFAFKELPTAVGHTKRQLMGEQLSESERKAQTRALIYQNYPGMAWILRNLYIED